MIKKCKRTLEENIKIGAIFMDYWKTFDTLNHGLLLAMPKAYVLQMATLKLMQNYLKYFYQRTKVNNIYILWSEIIAGVSQGCVLGPLLFDIFLHFLYSKKSVFK